MTPTFDNSYARLPQKFHSIVEPDNVPAPRCLRVNEELAAQLGFDPQWLCSEEGAQYLVGNRLFEGAEPRALVYAGHQFGNWVPRLGDGRAVYIGEVLDADGKRFELQYKGSGRTPYSRGGDGKAPLGPILREFLISEAMHALGVPTTRVLGAATTGEKVYRESMLPGAVLIRVASSHIRIGTFEYFASRREHEALNALVHHTAQRHYPELDENITPGGLLKAFAHRLAALVAKWQGVGFIHGVMNTDNMLLCGETVDYGPCAFMNEFDPATVFSSIDHYGRYAYGNQPAIAQWNLARFAEAMAVAIDSPGGREAYIEVAQEVINAFPENYEKVYLEVMRAKLGLSEAHDNDSELIADLFAEMANTNTDFTLFFRWLTEQAGPENGLLPESFKPDEAFEPWLERWRARSATAVQTAQERQKSMSRVNPVFIPRNHRVEYALEQAVQQGSLKEFDTLLKLLRAPFDYDPEYAQYAHSPESHERVTATFCGT